MIPMQYSYVVTYSIHDENSAHISDTIWNKKQLTPGDIHQLVRKNTKDSFNSEPGFTIHHIAEKSRLDPDYVADQFIYQLKFLFFLLVFYFSR